MSDTSLEQFNQQLQNRVSEPNTNTPTFDDYIARRQETAAQINAFDDYIARRQEAQNNQNFEEYVARRQETNESAQRFADYIRSRQHNSAAEEKSEIAVVKEQQKRENMDNKVITDNTSSRPGKTVEQVKAEKEQRLIDRRLRSRGVERDFLHEAADIPLKVGQGAVMGVRMIADAFGADNPASEALKASEEWIDDLMSAQAKNDAQEVALIMQAAEDEGIMGQLSAAFEAFKVAPVDLISNALGTAAPAIIATITTGGTATVAGGATLIGTGALMGAGVTKSSIYDATEQAFLEQGVTPEQAEAIATEAQAYTGENADSILTGTVLGAIASRFGIDKPLANSAAKRVFGKLVGSEAAEEAAERGVIANVARSAVAEGLPEAAQGGHEQFAANLALNREGIDTPLGRGVVGQAALEGFAGAGLGAGGPAITGTIDKTAETAAKGFNAVNERINREPEDAPDAPENKTFMDNVRDIKDTIFEGAAEVANTVKSQIKVEQASKNPEEVAKAADVNNEEHTPEEKVLIVTHENARPTEDSSPEEIEAFQENAENVLLNYLNTLTEEISNTTDKTDKTNLENTANQVLAQFKELYQIRREDNNTVQKFNDAVDKIKESGVVPNEIVEVLGSDGGKDIPLKSLKKLQENKEALPKQEQKILDQQIEIQSKIVSLKDDLKNSKQANKDVAFVSMEAVEGTPSNLGYIDYLSNLSIAIKNGSEKNQEATIRNLENFYNLQVKKKEAFTAVIDAYNAGNQEAVSEAVKIVEDTYNWDTLYKDNGDIAIGTFATVMHHLNKETVIGAEVMEQANTILGSSVASGSDFKAQGEQESTSAIEDTEITPTPTPEATVVEEPGSNEPGAETNVAGEPDTTVDTEGSTGEDLPGQPDGAEAQAESSKKVDQGRSATSEPGVDTTEKIDVVPKNNKQIAPDFDVNANNQIEIDGKKYGSIAKAFDAAVAENQDGKALVKSDNFEADLLNLKALRKSNDISAKEYSKRLKQLKKGNKLVDRVPLSTNDAKRLLTDIIKTAHIQHPQLKQALINSGNAEITASDDNLSYWSLLPEVMTEIRKEYQDEINNYTLPQRIIRSAGDKLKNIVERTSVKSLANNVLHNVVDWAQTYETDRDTAVAGQKLNKSQRKLLSTFHQFDSAFKRELENIFDPKQNKYPKQNYLHYFTDEAGILDPNLQTMMAAVLYQWLGNRAGETLGLTKQSIARYIFGDSNASFVFSSDMEKLLKNKGIPAESLATMLGQEVMQKMGYRVKKNNPRHTENAMAMSLGYNLIFVAEELDLLESTSLNKSEVNSINKRYNQLRAEGIVDDDMPYAFGDRNFIRAKIIDDKVTSKIDSIKKTFKGNKQFFDDLFGLENIKKQPSFKKPSKKSINTKVKRTDIELTQEVQDILLKKSHEPYQLNDTYEAIANYSAEELRTLFGVVPQEDLKQMLPALRIQAEGKNLEINTFIEDYLEFIEEIKKQPAKTRSQFYYEFEIWANSRIGMKNNVMNYQSSKLARQLVGLSSMSTKIDLTIDEDQNLPLQRLYTAAAEWMGENVLEMENLEEIKEAVKNKIGVKGPLREAYIEIKKQLAGDKFDRNKIIESVTQKNEHGIETISALTALAKYSLAVENNEKSFITTLAREVDGKTNGAAITTMQFVYNEYKKGNLDRDTFLKQAAIIVAAVGGKASDHVSKKTDIYATFAKDVQELIDLETDPENIALLGLNNDISKLFEESDENTIDDPTLSRDVAKNPVIQFLYGATAGSIGKTVVNDFITNIYQQIEDTKDLDKSERDIILNGLNRKFATVLGEPLLTPKNYEQFEFTSKQETILRNRLEAALVDKITTVLQRKFGKITRSTKNLSESNKYIGNMYTAVYQHFLAKKLLEKDVDDIELTIQDEEDIHNEMKEAGLLPTMPTAISGEQPGLYLWANAPRTHNMRPSIKDLKKRDFPDIVDKGLFATEIKNLKEAGKTEEAEKLIRFRDKKTRLEIHHYKGEPIKNSATPNRKNGIKEAVSVTLQHRQNILNDYKAAVLQIHSIDAQVMLEIYKAHGVMGIHDAIMMPLDQEIDTVNSANEIFIDVNKKYPVLYNNMMNLRNSADAYKAFAKNNPEVKEAIDTEIDNLNQWNKKPSHFNKQAQANLAKKTLETEKYSSAEQFYARHPESDTELKSAETEEQKAKRIADEQVKLIEIRMHYENIRAFVNTPGAILKKKDGKFIASATKVSNFSNEDLQDVQESLNFLSKHSEYTPELERARQFVQAKLDNSDYIEILGSNPGIFDESAFNPSEIWEVNGEKAMDLFDQLPQTGFGNKVEDPAHADYLKNLLISFGITDTVDSLIVKLEEVGDETKGYTVTREDGSQEVYVMAASQASTNGIRMSVQETYVHELLHVLSQDAINSHSKAKNELARLYEDIKKDPNIDYKAFLDNPQTATQEEIDAAKIRYNYIFNNQNAKKIKYRDPNTGRGYDHVKSPHLHEFFALGLSNQNFIRALKKAKTPKSADTENKTWFDRIADFLFRIMEILDVKYNNMRKQDAATQLQFIGRELVKHKEKTKKQISYFHKVTKAANDKAIFPAMNFITESIRKGARSKLISESKYKTVRHIGGIVENVRLNNFDEYARIVNDVRRRLGISADNIINYMFREMRGTTRDNRFWHKLLILSNRLIDQGHKSMDANTRLEVLDAFDEEPTEQESEALTKVGIRTDLSVLDQDYSLQEIADFINPNKKELEKEIKHILNSIDAGYPREIYNFYKNMSYSLASIMVRGRATEEDTFGNAYSIARMYGADYKKKVVHEDIDDITHKIDKLKTLYAIQLNSQGMRKRLHGVMKNEIGRPDGGGIGFILQLLKHNKEQSLNRLFNGKHAMLRAGFSKEIYSENVTFRYGSEEDAGRMAQEGYYPYVAEGDVVTLDDAHKSAEPLVMYINKQSQLTTYQRGIASMQQEATIGTTIMDFNIQRGETRKHVAQNDIKRIKANKKKNKQDVFTDRGGRAKNKHNNLLIPVNDENGNIVEYRYIMQEHTKDNVLERDNSFEKILGKMEAGIDDKLFSRLINKKVILGLHSEWRQNFSTGNKDKFVKLSLDAKEHKFKEAWQMLPEYMREDAKDVFKEDAIYIREELFELVFGRRKFALADYGKDIRKSGEEPNLIQSTAMFLLNRKGVRVVEDIIVDIFKLIKDIIVIRSAVVLKDNVISNSAILMQRGLGIADIGRYKKEALIEANRYQKLLKKESKLVRAINLKEQRKSSASKVGNLNKEIKELESTLQDVRELIRTNAVRELAEAGVNQTIVEDVSLEDNPNNIKSNIEKFLEPVTNVIPGVVKEVGKNVFLTQDTQAYKVLRDATQVSDFVARYALHQHNIKNKGMNKGDSFEDVIESFIHYDLPTHKGIQWMNDTGIWMFTKFFFRIQQIIFRSLFGHTRADGSRQDANPAAVGAFFATQMLIGDVADIYENGIVTGRGSQTFDLNLIDTMYRSIFSGAGVALTTDIVN